jgi:serine protease AprX
MIRKLGFLLIVLAFLSVSEAFSQLKYWVFLSDKDGVEFSYTDYFDAATIEKRQRKGLAVFDETDLPLRKDYCQVLEETAPILVKSRWLNAVSMSFDEHQKKKILSLPFVTEIVPQTLYSRPSYVEEEKEISDRELSLLLLQTDILGGATFRKNNINGKGVRIAILDGGFPGVDILDAFRHIRNGGRIIDTYDFVKKREDVYDYSSHGTMVMACIAGMYDSIPIGLAPEAEFLLARTEVNTEVYSEEENWAAAMEWADKNGADIISSSLGYTYHRYFPQQMDGKSTLVSRMANIAASKGMLVINAIGNDGDKDWEVMGAPADADSVLSIGGIDSRKGIHSKFSSYGPTFDKRLKPNVVAFSDVATISNKGLGIHYGTSFSTPLVSGFAACVMQIHPEWDNMKVFSELEKSGHLYPYYDYAHGYGIPQASYFLEKKLIKIPTFSVKVDDGNLIVYILSEDNLSDTTSEINTQQLTIKYNNESEGIITSDDNDSTLFASAENAAKDMLNQNYLYYHFAEADNGQIRKYFVVDMDDAVSYNIKLDDLKENELVRIHFRGYTSDFKP